MEEAETSRRGDGTGGGGVGAGGRRRVGLVILVLAVGCGSRCRCDADGTSVLKNFWRAPTVDEQMHCTALCDEAKAAGIEIAP